MPQPWVILALQMWISELWGPLGRRTTPVIWQPPGCSHSVRWALRHSGCEKHRILVPDCWDAHERNDFNKPRLLHPPVHRKVPNSLTWDIWFSLIHKNTFDVQTTCPLLQTSTSPESSPLPSWKSSLEATWEATSRIYVLKISTK